MKCTSCRSTCSRTSKANTNAGDLPKAEYLCAHHICMPLYANMTDADAEYTVASLRDALALV